MDVFLLSAFRGYEVVKYEDVKHCAVSRAPRSRASHHEDTRRRLCVQVLSQQSRRHSRPDREAELEGTLVCQSGPPADPTPSELPHTIFPGMRDRPFYLRFGVSGLALPHILAVADEEAPICELPNKKCRHIFVVYPTWVHQFSIFELKQLATIR